MEHSYLTKEFPRVPSSPAAVITGCRHRRLPSSPAAVIAGCRHRRLPSSPAAVIAGCRHRRLPSLPAAVIAGCRHRRLAGCRHRRLPSSPAIIYQTIVYLFHFSLNRHSVPLFLTYRKRWPSKLIFFPSYVFLTSLFL